MANPDAKGGPAPPPNLRVSDTEDRECDSCAHYQRGRCELPVLKDFVLPVDGEWLCDGYSKGRNDPDDQPRTLREARGPAREYLRGSKTA